MGGSARHSVEVSEEIFALFGEGSEFHRTHGFHIDGVDETTAMLPPDWMDRASRRDVECDGRMVQAIAPEPHDLAVSKLCRLEAKDIAFVSELARSWPLNRDILLERLSALVLDAVARQRAADFIQSL